MFENRYEISDPDYEAELEALVGPEGQWRETRDVQLDMLAQFDLDPGMTFVDLGCGTLRTGLPLIGYLDPGRYIGIDIDQKCVDAARGLISHFGLEEREPRIVHSDSFGAKELPEDGFADRIWSFQVLIHMPRPVLKDCLKAIARMLKPDGKAWITVKFAKPGVDFKTTGKWRYFPVTRGSEAFYVEAAAEAGLACRSLGKLGDYGLPSKLPGAVNSLLELTHAPSPKVAGSKTAGAQTAGPKTAGTKPAAATAGRGQGKDIKDAMELPAIAINSFPKSGNTWVRTFLERLDPDNTKSIPDRYRDSRLGLRLPHAGEDCYIYKTHDRRLSNIAFDKELRHLGVLHVVRHPLDVFLSWVNYLNLGGEKLARKDLQVPKGRFPFAARLKKPVEELSAPEMQALLGVFIAAGSMSPKFTGAGSWLGHTQSMMNGERHYPVWTVCYEDLIEAPEEGFAAIASLFGFSREQALAALAPTAEETAADGKFFWRQKAGNFRDLLSADHIAWYEDICAKDVQLFERARKVSAANIARGFDRAGD